MRIEHILKLARITLGNREKKELEKEFSSILNFVEKLKELEIKNIKPMTYPTDLQNILRKDEISQAENISLRSQKLLNLAPQTKARSIKTKQIL